MEILVLIVVAVLGHVMAVLWHIAERRNSQLCRTRIYDVPLKKDQVRRDLKNSVLTPIHAVILGAMLGLGFFENVGWWSFPGTLVATFLWAEIWHYFSHRAFHLPSLLWIHREHHRSQINSPVTAISFSFL